MLEQPPRPRCADKCQTRLSLRGFFLDRLPFAAKAKTRFDPIQPPCKKRLKIVCRSRRHEDQINGGGDYAGKGGRPNRQEKSSTRKR
jgi:hypothetical protein